MPVQLNWGTPEVGQPITTYNVFRRVGLGDINPITHFLSSVPGTQTDFEDSTYVPSTLENPGYQYAVSASNDDGEGPLSNAILITFDFM